MKAICAKAVLLTLCLTLGATSSGFAYSFLDLTSITGGSNGSFVGTLGGVTVNGAITTSSPGFVLNTPTTPTNSWELSTIDNSSPQFSYSTVYTPTIALTDRVGYTSFVGSINPATITITFSAPVTNPIIDVANLDEMQITASGAMSLILLSGNGGGGDGLQVVGDVISDANPLGVGQDPSDPPLLTGDRSAYGSVELEGTFTTLTLNVVNNGNGDGGSFTLVTPEPDSLVLLGFGLLACAGAIRRKLAQ